MVLKAKLRYHRSFIPPCHIFKLSFSLLSPSHPLMASLSNSLVISRNSVLQPSPGSLDKWLQSSSSTLSFSLNGPSIRKLPASRRSLVVRASRSDSGKSSAGIFVGGFVLGGLIVGALGCVYAPQISKALAGTDRKEIMRKLPKFIYDEEKALEKTRKVLTEKIEQLNSAIDEVSSQLRTEDAPNGVAVNSDEIEAAI